MGGLSRSFLLHVPPARVTATPPSGEGRALLVALHGSGGDGDAMRALTHLDAAADREGFVVAYPNGYRGTLGSSESTWNAGSCCGAAAKDRVDDVGFIVSIIETVSARVKVDARRVYVLGFSDGGRMAYRVACTASDRIAAFAVVAGSLVLPGCAPSAPVPLIAFHGTSDPSVSYSERPETSLPQTIDIPVSPSVAVWATGQKCTSSIRSNAGSHVTSHAFTDCRLGDVVFYSMEGGKHVWPESATPAIVSFFLEHRK